MASDFKNRRLQLMHALQQKNTHQALIFDPASIFYYTGFLSEPHERFMALFLKPTGEECLFVPALDETAAREVVAFDSIIPISDVQDPFAVFHKTVGELDGNLGIEGHYLPYNRFMSLKDLFPTLTFQTIEHMIEEQRTIKTAAEITEIKHAIQLIEQVLENGKKRIKIGMTEREITAELEFIMRTVGADAPSFATIVLAGKNAALPHGVPGNYKIQRGDFLLIDFGVVKNGYCSDITRTFAIGEVSDEHRKLYELVLAANNAGIHAVSAGIPLKEIDGAARKVISDGGFGEYFTTRVGHGLGIDVHESPSVHGENDSPVQKGMVFTIEPGIYIPGDTGIRIEDIVYVNEAGTVDVLTTYPKSLEIIEG